MKPQPRNRIASMLTEAYHQLGVNNVWELDKRTNEALAYLRKDREHYIEVAEADTPEYRVSTNNGVICNLIPLAREIHREQEKNHIRENTLILLLMISDAGNRYVYSHSVAKQYADASQNSYTYPIYRFVNLEDIRKTLQICAPQEIRPVATELDWEAYGMMFTAFAHLEHGNNINNIPHKTERAMQAYTYTLPQILTISGRSYGGKLVPLAWEQTLWNELREDHQYSCRKELCLLITPEKPYYVMATHHIYKYFRKEIYDNVPGGCSYEPTEEKQETTYTFINLSDLPRHMSPRYY